ncbi:unnamed protein product [Ilex paraguariensis]|uniref:Uncharacterized protein n=1 Tax=Ilex paraguariensis TaxID=185542 RepID=A0ABC8UDV9_9AQUA
MGVTERGTLSKRGIGSESFPKRLGNSITPVEVLGLACCTLEPSDHLALLDIDKYQSHFAEVNIKEAFFTQHSATVTFTNNELMLKTTEHNRLK